MIIDAHAHSCGIYGDEKLILENMKKQGIDRIILSAGQKGSTKNYNLPNLGKHIKYAKEIKKSIFIHMILKEQVHEFIHVLKEYKDTIFIVAHLIGIEEFDNTINKNIYFDISCPE